MIFEIRPHWKTNEIMHTACAKATYVKKLENWKVYWHRQDGKWHRYDPEPEVKHLKDWLELVQKDKHGCFWG